MFKVNLSAVSIGGVYRWNCCSAVVWYCVYAMPISWNQFMKWANSCVHKHFIKNLITHESWQWIQSQCTKCWGTAYFTAYYSIELYIKFKKFDSLTNIISWICLCCINIGYYNFMYWRKHKIHSINIVWEIWFLLLWCRLWDLVCCCFDVVVVILMLRFNVVCETWLLLLQCRLFRCFCFGVVYFVITALM